MQSRNTAKNAKKKKRNSSIVLLTGFFVLLFTGMMGYLVYYVATNEEALLDNSYNGRQELLLSENYRGSILAADGTILAQTVIGADGSETREYPYGEKFAHVVGYATNGRMGVEEQANYYLIQSNAALATKVENTALGLKNPGDSVYTSLNVDIQEAAFRALDNYKGAIIVTEVKTGRILAMVSKPAFDPNQIAETWSTIVSDDSSTVLLNRVTQGLYPPGSTFKMLTALEYIRENPDTYDKYSFLCKGSFTEGENRINCYHGTSHGQVDFTQSFAHSCNSSFANIGLSLDRDAFAETLNDFLFNNPLPVSFLYSQSSVSVDSTISDNDMMQTAIGQGKTLVTPLQLNMVTATIANGGTMMTPYVIDRIESADGAVVKQFKPSSLGQILSEEEADALTLLMQAVVEEGTASSISGLEYTVAGKTGSAEYNNIKGQSHAWFTGFAPAEDPEVCVTIIMEGAGNGSDNAVPIARRLFNAYFNQ